MKDFSSKIWKLKEKVVTLHRQIKTIRIMTKEQEQYNKVIGQFADMCKGCKTYPQIKQKIYSFLCKRYGKSDVVKHYADDFTESVALRLKIPQT